MQIFLCEDKNALADAPDAIFTFEKPFSMAISAPLSLGTITGVRTTFSGEAINIVLSSSPLPAIMAEKD